jgi:hypothetical protein
VPSQHKGISYLAPQRPCPRRRQPCRRPRRPCRFPSSTSACPPRVCHLVTLARVSHTPLRWPRQLGSITRSLLPSSTCPCGSRIPQIPSRSHPTLLPVQTTKATLPYQWQRVAGGPSRTQRARIQWRSPPRAPLGCRREEHDEMRRPLACPSEARYVPTAYFASARFWLQPCRQPHPGPADYACACLNARRDRPSHSCISPGRKPRDTPDPTGGQYTCGL